MSGNNSVDLSQTILAGIDIPTLQAWLTQAQTAYMTLMSGARIVTATYTQGDGVKTVQYQKQDAAQLTMWIRQLQTQLGTGGGRRPMRPVFSGR